ncbi:hypothetical protein DFJ74DRAFT_771049 [Hyaloraphidium curvatum]|nr:hypothetical protein DFJ74DRAFT_771049 [Hyaloraphidium curvatum]
MAPRELACEPCSRRKRPCRRSRAGGPCSRCLRLGDGDKCVPVDPTLSRRQRERLKREERAAAEGPTPHAASSVSPAAGGREGSPGSVGSPRGGRSSSGPAPHADRAATPLSAASGAGGPGAGIPYAAEIEAYLASSVPRPPDAADSLPDAALFPAIAAYWDIHNVISPVLHRLAFEEAFLAPGPLYGSRPVVLLLAMAARGARGAEMPGVPEEERLRYARAFFARARDLLLAAGADPPADRRLTPLEASQAALILIVAALPNGMEGDLDTLIAYLAANMALLGPDDDGPPAAPIAHLRRELVVRLRVFQTSSDQLAARIRHGQPLLGESGFALPREMPVPEGIFELPYAGAAAWGSAPRLVLDLSPLVASEPDPDAVRAAVADVMPGIFAGWCSRLAMLFTAAALHRLQGRLRSLSRSSGIDPMKLASRDPSPDDTPEEVLYRCLAGASDAAVSALASAFPAHVAEPLHSGDPSPLLDPSCPYFPDVRHGHAFLSTYLDFCGHGIRSWFSDPGVPDDRFFASTQFLAALEWAIVGTGIMRGQLRSDPRLRWAKPAAAIPALAIGGLQAAALRACGRVGGGPGGLLPEGVLADWIEDAETAATYVEAVATQLQTLVPIAKGFRTMIADTRRAALSPDASEPPPASFGGTVG